MNASPTRRLFQRSSEAFRFTGFNCAGEIGPVGGKNFLHGFTASIALFVDP
jgi:small ligand-binding sensory domain FIST